jgi:hypothetical protein
MAIHATILYSACLALLLAASKPGPTYPKYKVDRKAMTVNAKHDRLGDVRLYKWAGVMPDTITDTLRFFARNAMEFINENTLNRHHCVTLENEFIERHAEQSSDIKPGQMEHWRDSLEQIYREVRYRKLDLRSDSIMLFDHYFLTLTIEGHHGARSLVLVRALAWGRYSSTELLLVRVILLG